MKVDSIYLLIDGKKIDTFTEYEVDLDLYKVNAFKVKLGRPGFRIRKFMEFQLYVNDRLEITGLVDKVEPGYSGSERSIDVTGRGLMGWLVDAHTEKSLSLANYDAKQLATWMLSDAPKQFFKLLKVDFAENITGRIKGKAAKTELFNTAQALSQIEMGMGRFDALSQFAASRGFLFHEMPDGRFVFDRLKEDVGTAAFRLVNRLDGRGNVLKGKLSDDGSKMYSKVTVIGQKQEYPLKPNASPKFNIEATKYDRSVPFFKPYVLKDEFGGDRPGLQAQMAIEKMRREAFQLVYDVRDHSQDGKNWTINELAHVRDEDEDFEVDGKPIDLRLAITGLTFRMNESSGTTTSLRLGLPAATRSNA